jgi:hypothetical protein
MGLLVWFTWPCMFAVNFGLVGLEEDWRQTEQMAVAFVHEQVFVMHKLTCLLGNKHLQYELKFESTGAS